MTFMPADNHGLFAVITTIQAPTACMEELSKHLAQADAQLVVIGDRKGPSAYDLPNTSFLDLDAQLGLQWDLARLLPTGHYARKNLGYLFAMTQGAECIYETDDDNRPLPEWKPRTQHVEATTIDRPGWINVYRCFTSGHIWPRGLPLDAMAQDFEAIAADAGASSAAAPIQQGLANNSPDVDAIWRLVLDAPFDFDGGPSIRLAPGCWCPFNSQTTWWWPEVFPLLYLPSYCSFRMTDIWRSFVAQRCLWELGHGVVFHAPEVIQERNFHDLMRDFEDEVPGYLGNRKIATVLENLPLAAGRDRTGENLRACYEALVEGGFVPAKELQLVDAWLEAIEGMRHVG
jgi:hypothetical protein